MAIPNFGDAGYVHETGLTEQLLIRLINLSNDAGGKMTGLRTQVDGAAASIRAAMQSSAGLVLQRRLDAWHADYARIEAAFIGPGSLTDRSEKMLIALRNSNIDATANAGAGES